MGDTGEKAVEISKLYGYPMENDAKWIIHTPEFSAIITEYNDELTGWDPRFSEIYPDVFHYGGNAYYILGHLSKQQGWRNERMERPDA